MNIVLCESAEKRAFTAGNKARTDTVKILVGCGYEHIALYRSKSSKPMVLAQMTAGCLKAMRRAGRGETIFIQYPYYPAMVNRALLSALSLGRRIRGYKIGLLIHDSIGLRCADISGERLRAETALFNRADYVVCHNDKMAKAFMENDGRGDYRVLGPFDYLYSGKPVDAATLKGERSIVIAGNLSKEKCGYVYQLSEAVEACSFNLYGLNYTGPENDRIRYKGQFAPEKLIEHLEGAFGLVWDGDSCDTCSGAFGEYLKYNNPHKFSLYIAAGLPLIVWRQSALAEYVEKLGIGLIVDSLYQLNDAVRGLSEADYSRMSTRVSEYREELINGCHLKEVVLDER